MLVRSLTTLIAARLHVTIRRQHQNYFVLRKLSGRRSCLSAA